MSNTHRHRAERHQREGYVLLLVLVAIVVSSVALTKLATTSARLAIDSIDQQDALQRKWGLTSCSHALLPHVGKMFDTRDERLGRTNTARPPALASGQIVLGQSLVTVVVADEDAKTNLNSLYHASDERVVATELRRILRPGVTRAIALRPVVASEQSEQRKVASNTDRDAEDSEDAEAEPPRAFYSWGDVLDIEQIHQTLGSDRDLPVITRSLTLWGRGKLNVARASDEAFLSTCRPIVQDGLAKRIIQRHREQALTGIKLIIEKEVTNPRDRERLLQTLGQSSSCFSIWAETETKRGRMRVFSVIEPDSEGIFNLATFSM
ncbi:MAG: hypothetical protein HKN47_17365 [Pirellulaceae bacterium]|nr:hypothetical protein [Pirellulaceae bacterium]